MPFLHDALRAADPPILAAHEALLDGDPARAVALLAACTPADPALRAFLLSVAYAELDRPADALAAAEAALAASPTFPEAHFNRACALEALDQPEAAEAAYRAALTHDPAFPDASRNLALLLSRAGSPAALEALTAAAAACPDDPLLAFKLAELLARERRLGDAIDALERAFALDPAARLAVAASPLFRAAFDPATFAALTRGR